jgi:hypothetical protein
MAIICPGCTTELPPEATSCYVCMRPRSRNEIFRGIHGEQVEARSRRRRPYIVLAVLTFLALGGYAWWRFGPAMKPASAKRPAAVAVQAPAPAPAPSPAAEAPSSYSSVNEPVYTSAPPPSLHRAKATPTKWRVSGRIYDLLTLKPVAGAVVSFVVPETGARKSVKTGRDGRYVLLLPTLKEGGYAPEVSHPDYRPGFLEESEEVPYREQSESRRIEAAQLLRENVIMHVPVSPANGANALTYDAVLTPIPR